MSNGATYKHTVLVVSHKLDVRMHVSDEYGVLYAKRFGRLLEIKV
jgi:ABC-type dipeptide/oligopeptide/nickel transport system ATPase subunit